MNDVYKAICTECEEDLRKKKDEGLDTTGLKVALYIGETGRILEEQAAEYIDSAHRFQMVKRQKISTDQTPE